MAGTHRVGLSQRGLESVKRVLITGGVGDHAAASGMMCKLAHRHGGLAVPVPKCYMHSVHQFYRRHEQIELEPYDSFDQVLRMREDKNSITAFSESVPPDISVDQFQYMYALAGVDYIERWAHNPIPVASRYVHPQHTATKPFSLIHDVPDRHYKIDPNRINPRFQQVYATDFSAGLLSWRWMVENAAEIEAIPSSIFILAEQLMLSPGVKLRLHRYARPYYPVWCDYETRYDWEILK